MTDVSAFSSVIDAAETNGEALVIYDLEDRVAFANQQHRVLYEAIDFDSKPRFSDIFLHCIETKKFNHPDVYTEPEEWLANAVSSRLQNPTLRFLRRHRDNRVFVIKSVRVDGVGSYQTRSSLSPDMVQGVSDYCSYDPNGRPANSDPAVELTDLRGRMTDITAALDAWRTPCVLVDRLGQIRHFNLAMGLLLDHEDGLSISGPLLKAHYKEDQERLLAIIRRYAKTRTGPGVATMRVRRRSGRSPYIISVNATVPGVSLLPHEEAGSALVLVADPDSGCTVGPQPLRQLYGLTELQAELATRLIRGDSSAAIAKATGIPMEIFDACVLEVMDRMGVDGPIAFTQRMADIAGILNAHQQSGW